MSTLKIDSVTKSFGGSKLLSDIFIELKQGDIIGLLGRNGCGKSTLLKIIFGTVNADSKHVRFNNLIITSTNQLRKHINYLTQDNFLPNNIKIKELVQLFLPIQKAKTVLQNKHIAHLLNKRNQDLSGGDKRLIEILLILHSEADFILLDEPFNGLSPLMKEYVCKLLQNIKKEKGIIITDHDYRYVLDISTELIGLKGGALTPIANQNELVNFGYLTPNW